MRTKQYLRVISVVILTICITVIPTVLSIQFNKLNNIAEAQTTNSIPSGYVGIWRGTGTRTNTNITWSLVMALIPGKIGSVVGISASPTYNCGGEITLQRVNNNNSIELSDNVTFGSCYGGGTLTLKQVSARQLDYEWRSPNYPTAAGSYQKVSNN